jgi:hypothetical protein
MQLSSATSPATPKPMFLFESCGVAGNLKDTIRLDKFARDSRATHNNHAFPSRKNIFAGDLDHDM